MKIKDGFMLRKVGGVNIVVAVGDASRDFNGIIRLNDVGCFLWQELNKDCSENNLVMKILNTYDVDEATAKNDVSEFINKLKGADLLGS